MDDLVAESKHDGMLGLHPFLYVDVAGFWRRLMLRLKIDIRVEVVSEVLKKRDFLLEFSFRREIADLIRSDCVFVLLLFDVFEVLTVLVCDYLGGIIEVNAS